MKMKLLTSAALFAAMLSVASPAFAQRTSTYPEGNIFLEPKVETPQVARAPAAEKLSPLNPLDTPDAGTVSKPPNRDAGNLAVERWNAYAEQLKALQNQQ